MFELVEMINDFVIILIFVVCLLLFEMFGN